MGRPVFDDLTDVYDSMVDWDKRLANEEPFYRRLFERVGVRRVLDAACGTGRHAAMFHRWGLRVEGADISPGMIDRARATFGEPAGLRWTVRGFGQRAEPERLLDAVVCVGNSIALAPGMGEVQKAVQEMLAAVRSGGILVLQVLNLWRLSDGPCVWQKCKRTTLKGEDVLILKGVHRSGSGGYVDLVVVPLSAPSEMKSESVPLLGLEAEELKSLLQIAGASRIQLFGSYDEQPYLREQSSDLIAIAEK